MSNFESEESDFSRRISNDRGIQDLLTDLDVAMHNMWVDVRDEIGYSGEYHPATVEVTVSVTSGGYETDGGADQRDPTDDPAACSMCGCHIGYGRSDEYCDGCARDLGAKPPMRTCMGCGQTGPEEQMETVDLSPEDEYYPEIKYLCQSCGGGD